MTIDEATAILKERTGDWHTQSAASAFVVSFYNEHRDRLRPADATFTTDAARDPVEHMRSMLAQIHRHLTRKPKMKRTRDVAGTPGLGSYTFASSEQTAMGQAVDPMAAGATLVSYLDGPMSAFFLGVDPKTGRGALYRSHAIDDMFDEGTTTAITGTSVAMRDAQTRDAMKQIEQRGISERVKQFWTEHPNG